jgi:hypothetical protein
MTGDYPPRVPGMRQWILPSQSLGPSAMIFTIRTKCRSAGIQRIGQQRPSGNSTRCLRSVLATSRLASARNAGRSPRQFRSYRPILIRDGRTGSAIAPDAFWAYCRRIQPRASELLGANQQPNAGRAASVSSAVTLRATMRNCAWQILRSNRMVVWACRLGKARQHSNRLAGEGASCAQVALAPKRRRLLCLGLARTIGNDGACVRVRTTGVPVIRLENRQGSNPIVSSTSSCVSGTCTSQLCHDGPERERDLHRNANASPLPAAPLTPNFGT